MRDAGVMSFMVESGGEEAGGGGLGIEGPEGPDDKAGVGSNCVGREADVETASVDDG